MTQQELVKLRKATDDAIGVVERKCPVRGPVNWANLSCREACWVENDAGQSYAQVLIEEAAPEAYDLRVAIGVELEKVGWSDVRVVTEW